MTKTDQEQVRIYLLLKHKLQDKTGLAPLYARISPPGQKLFEVHTKIHVPVCHWDQQNQQLNITYKNPQLAKEIRTIVESIQETHDELASCGSFYTPVQFRLMLFGESTKPRHYTFKFIYEKHQHIEEDNIAPGTWKNYYTTNKFFLDFIAKELRAEDVVLTRINRQLMIEFMTWLKRRTPDKGQRPCTQTTAQKHVERIVRLLNFAVDMQYIPFNPVMNLKKKRIEKDRTYLDQEELQLFEQAILTTEGMTEARDCFLFSCYTGLSFSDIKSFNRKDLVKDLAGNLCISKVRKKTQRTKEIKFFVPLLPQAQEILNKYKEHPYCLYNNVLLPVKCNQVYNRQIKQIAESIGIYKDLSSHAARHTFATTVTQDNGVSLESISKMLGHTQIKM